MQQGNIEALIKADFGQVTPEYSMKWDATEPAQGHFSWDNSDYIVNWTHSNNKTLHGHALIWHTALRTWVSDIKNESVLTSRSKIRAWDVANEIFNDNGTLRNNTFFNAVSELFVGLYINDYNLDNKGWVKVSALVNKVNQWMGQGIPIDGIGSQSHLVPNMSSNVQGALEVLATAHVSEIAITEMDIDSVPPADYAAVVGACLNVTKCVGVTTWGLSVKQSWESSSKPLFFDDNYNPKPVTPTS
ncbi:glycoside hydrolase [Colletotrichum caudatum]|nr:glycoside hydrolase [Colletotrichum caudatum]